MRLRYFEGEILIGAASGSILGELCNVDFFMLLDDVFMDFLDGGEEREEESFRYMGNMRGCFCFSSFRSRFNGSRIRFSMSSSCSDARDLESVTRIPRGEPSRFNVLQSLDTSLAFLTRTCWYWSVDTLSQ